MNRPLLDLEALRTLTDANEVRALECTLEPLERDTELLLFIAPGCPICPLQIRSAATVALASPRIRLEIVDVTHQPERAAGYEVHSVPTTVVAHETALVGLVPPQELGWRVVEADGEGNEKLLFAFLVESGLHADAARRLADGRATQAFYELWARSTLGDRLGLLLVAQEALLLDPRGLDPLVPCLLAGLDGNGPLTRSDARRGDTADLLSRIGHSDARPVLERMARDANAQVAEVARAALDDLEGAARIREAP